MIQTTRPEEGAQRPSSAPAIPPAANTPLDKTAKSWIVLWSSFLFAVLQSVCTAFVAISGLRLLIGVSSLAAAAGIRLADRLHVDQIRIPMILLALAGSLINLYAIWRIRRLRQRPASQWRMQPVPPAKLRSENLQIALAAATLGLLLVEEALHVILHQVL